MGFPARPPLPFSCKTGGRKSGVVGWDGWAEWPRMGQQEKGGIDVVVNVGPWVCVNECPKECMHEGLAE